jgi:hypothetical protein
MDRMVKVQGLEHAAIPHLQITVIRTLYHMTARGLIPDFTSYISNFEVTHVLTQNVFFQDLHWGPCSLLFGQ